MTVAEAKLVIEQAQADEKAKQKDEARRKLAATIKELQQKRRLKQKVDRAVSVAISVRSGVDEMLQQMLAMLGQHDAARPRHMDALPDCSCQECEAWRGEEKSLRQGHVRLLQHKREAFADPDADTTLQRNLANEIVNLERAAVNLENRLRDQPVGARRLEGSLGAVR